MDRRRTARRALAALAAAAGLGAVATLGVLGAGVARELRRLDSARSDNTPWTLAQAEVEFLDLRAAVAAAGTAPADLAEIRREFDIFWSRVRSIAETPVYAAPGADPRHAAALAAAEAFLAEAVALVDAPDAELAAALPRLAARIEAARPAIRALSVTGLESFAAQADLRREAVAATLLRLAVVAAALVGALVAVALVLARLRRLAEARAAALELATERLRTVFSTSLDAIVVADRHGRILDFNEAAERIFGFSRAEAVGRALDETIIPDRHREAHRRGMARHRETGETAVTGRGRIRIEARRSDGEIFPVELAIQSAPGADGEIFVGFLRDISHRVAAERELVAARDRAVAGERAKAEFLAVTSHEIRTPLNGLPGTLSLLADTALDPRQARLLANMRASGALLERHANDVLDISRHEAGKVALHLGPVDPGALVAAVVDAQRDLARAAGTAIGWARRGAPLPAVETDEARLRRILVNLVGNAVKFTRDGEVTVELSAAPAPDGSAELTVAVRDTGIGIPAEALERIFGDFETVDGSYGRAAGGAGLGLGIARRMAEALGGEIAVDSALGEGSTFRLRLPVRPLAEAPRPAPAPAPAAPRRVLVVEDNAINREVLHDMLAADGHAVACAEDGLAGVALAARAPFDLILMDIGLPAIDGREALRRLRAAGVATPAVAVTAHVLPEERGAFRRDGFAEVIAKPLDRAALRRLLAGAAPAPAPLPAPEIDLRRLADLRADLGSATADRLLARFLAEADDAVARPSDPEAEPPAEAGRRAHHLASSAAIFGATALRARLNALETACAPEAEPARRDALRREFAPLWQATRAALLAPAEPA